ncbi:MAG TPA: hypothetical protein VN253_22395 [Kofleriaceae bacterium]|nr:hypothetical protein [Kofleriaceae bacterium]
MARSTALDGDWVFDNDLARFGDPWNEPRTKTGRKSIVHPVGPALVWTPLIWIAQAGAVIANLGGAEVPTHGYTLWHQRFVFLSSALFACGAALLGRKVAKRSIGGAWNPSYAAICVLLGTPLTYYATCMPSYSHAMDAFACAAFFAYWALSIGRRDLRRAAFLGVLLGLAMLVRVQELAMGIVVALEIAVQVVGALRERDIRVALRWMGSGVLTLAVAFVVFVPQLLEWYLVFGTFTELPQGGRYTRPEAPMIGELLFSARNGWLSSTPIAYLGVIGLFLAPKRARLLATGLLAAIAIQVYLNSTIFDWWAQASFGQRRMCNVSFALVVGFSILLWRMGRLVARLRWSPRLVWHGVFVLIAVPLVAWNVERVWSLRGGKPAPAELIPSCCDRVPGPLRGTARWVYERMGNPFQFPANLLFAFKHGVDLKRWDLVIGNYPLVPPWNALGDDQLPRYRGVWRIGNPEIKSYLVDGFSASTRADRAFRWTVQPSATVLVPNLMPYGQRLTLWLAPGGSRSAIIRWNGDVVATTPELSTWTAVSFDLPNIELHTNELTIEAKLGPSAAPASWPSVQYDVGVAVADLEFAFLPRH